MRLLTNLKLYVDSLGQEVTTPVLRIGSGAPHVVMVALQHGWEIIGLDTALQIMSSAKVNGTLTLVSVASPIAYQEGTRLVGQSMGPSSKQLSNANRVHPGKADGNIAERSAAAIDKFISSIKPDYIVDLHSYAQQSMPHCIVDKCEAKLQRQIEDWLNKSGNVWYREYEDNVVASNSLDNALTALWTHRGTSAVTIELGPTRAFSLQQSHMAQTALKNLLVACGAIKARVTPQRVGHLGSQTWQRTEVVYTQGGGGYLRPLVSTNVPVKKGEAIAEIVSVNGKIAGMVEAPVSGILFIWHDEYRVMSGSLVGVVLKAVKP